MNKKVIKTIIIVFLILALLASGIAVSFKYGIEPVIHLQDVTTFYLKGNSKIYSVKRVESSGSSKLKDKTIIFLGSSVTYGSKSKGVSFPDYIEKLTLCTAVKEAVSGTTLVDTGSTSYVSRMEKLKTKNADLLVCQLSTNDATKNLPLGAVAEGFDKDDFDTETVAGAIEYIIAYSKERWSCPVVFFTNPEYDNAQYSYMVSLLLEIQQKWGITVIDLWSNDEFNAISPELNQLYMADDIHPTQAGYLKWWTPEFIRVLEGEF